jgi:hypothetical protein
MSLIDKTTLLSDTERAAAEAKFKVSRYAMSYSSEKVLREDPKRFYNEKVLGIKRKVHKKAFDEGHLLHTLVLEPHLFEKQYAIATTTGTLSDSVRGIIDNVFDFRELNNSEQTKLSEDLEDFKSLLLNFLTVANLYQKMGDDKKFDRVLTPETREYWGMLLKNKDKILVSQEVKNTIQKKVDNFFERAKVITDKMGLTAGLTSDDVLVINEVMLSLPRPELPFDEKGIIDNLCVHYKHQKIYVNDVKSTSGTIAEFEKEVRRFGYSRQAAKYSNLAEEFKRQAVKSDPSVAGFPIEFRFIAFDKNGYFGSIKVSQESLAMYKEWHQRDLQKLSNHFKNWDFENPTDFLENMEKEI